MFPATRFPVKKQVEGYFFGEPPARLGEKFLFIQRDARLEEYQEYLTQVEPFGNVWNGVTGRLRHERVAVIATGAGPNLVGDAVYALDRPGAVCLYSGTCGALDAELALGDYFLATQAICGDGFTLHLGQPPFSRISGDPATLQALREALPDVVSCWTEGLTFTTNSVVRETESGFWRNVEEECRVIEMGTAALYGSARATGKKAAAYFWVSDLPLHEKSFFDALSPGERRLQEYTAERSVEVDLALLSSVQP